MALSKVRGYNILLTVDGKSIVGTISDTLSGGGTWKETLQKSDVGYTQYTNFGYEGTLSVNAYTPNGEGTTGQMDAEDLMKACRDSTTGTFIVAFGTDTGDPKVTGNCTFLTYTLNSDSEEYSDCTIELGIREKPTFTTV
jgi:hypothetical protein